MEKNSDIKWKGKYLYWTFTQKINLLAYKFFEGVNPLALGGLISLFPIFMV